MAFYDTCYSRDRDKMGLRGIVAHEWRVLLENPATLSLVVEDFVRPADRRLVGCCQMAFVTDGFVRWAETAPTPGGNIQATHPLPDGTWPLLTRGEVGKANAEGELNALFTRWGRAGALLTREEQMEIGRFMHDTFTLLTRGYRFREILIDVIGEPPRQQALRAGFVDRNRYEAHFAEHLLPLTQRPFLMGVTREEAFATEGCVMSHYFIHLRPRFGFNLWEQEMLCLCLRLPGATNATLARALDIPLNTVKNRWLSLYRRVEEVAPDLLPQSEADKERGPEKRRRLLQYLREHPEDLRPYKPMRRKT